MIGPVTSGTAKVLDKTLGASLTAQLPIRVSSKAASNPLTITATLVRADGQTHTLDRTTAPGRDYSGAAGRIYRVNVPDTLVPGRHRIVIETTIGRSSVARAHTGARPSNSLCRNLVSRHSLT